MFLQKIVNYRSFNKLRDQKVLLNASLSEEDVVGGRRLRYSDGQTRIPPGADGIKRFCSVAVADADAFVPGEPLKLSPIFEGKAGAYPSTGAPLLDRLMVLYSHIMLGWSKHHSFSENYQNQYRHNTRQTQYSLYRRHLP
jgi:hypothetical protein